MILVWLGCVAPNEVVVTPPAPVEVRARAEVRWSRTLGAAVSGLVADGGGVVAWTGVGVDALDLEGRQRWARAGGLVPVGAGLAVSGGELWELGADGALGASSGLGGTLVGGVATGPGLRAWSLAEGLVGTNAGWSLVVGGRPVGTPAVSGDRVYVAAGDRVVAGSARGREWVVEFPAPLLGGPLVGPGGIFVAFGPVGGEPGGVLALGEDGGERWRQWTRDRPVGIATGELVYVSDRDRRVYALEPGRGTWRWECEGFAPFSTGPVVAGRVVYAGGEDGRVWAMDAWDGGVLWTRELGAGVTAGPVVVGGLVVVGLGDGRVVAIGA